MEIEKIETNRFPLYCRTCLKQYQGIKHLVNDLEAPIFLLLKQCADYDPNGNYPDGICHECLEKLVSFEKFQNNCRETKIFLERLTASDNKVFITYFEAKDLACDILNGEIENENAFHDERESNEICNEDQLNSSESTNEENTTAKDALINKNTAAEEEINGETSKKNKCEICGKSFSSTLYLQIHMLSHAKKRVLKCDICDHEFNTECKLERHVKEHTLTQTTVQKIGGQVSKKRPGKQAAEKDSETKILKSSEYMCETCGKCLQNRFSLKVHQISHLPKDQRPFKCSQCDKRFVNQAHLQQHVMRHNGTKNYECSYCGVKKTTAREIQIHISNVHTKDRRVRCDICSKVFLNPGILKRHKKVVHCGERKYKCSHCSEIFASKSTLTRHIMRHTGEKPHQCTVCGHKFIQIFALKRHMKTHQNLNDTS